MEVDTMRHKRIGAGGFKPLIGAIALVGVSLVFGCDRGVERMAMKLTGGDPRRGRQVLREYGCQSCHTIPGVRGANGLVGPPLNQIARRVYIAGMLPNTPENMMRWIRNPAQVQMTAMPNMGVTDADARDIASFLYTLR
jgi:cytochrome c